MKESRIGSNVTTRTRNIGAVPRQGTIFDSTSPGAAASLKCAGAEWCFILGINFEPGRPLAILPAAFLIRYAHFCTFAENPVSIVDRTEVLLKGHSRQRCGRMQSNGKGRNEARAVHRRCQHSCRRKGARLRYRLQAPADGISEPRHVGARILLHRDRRGSGVLRAAAVDRLARLQRLHRCYETSERI